MLRRHWVLVAALAGALIVYLPTLRSPFYGDDYLLLLASRDMSWPDFLRSIWDPGADPGLLRLSDTYWRPLSFLSFRVLYPIFGDSPMPYHLVMLGIHFASVVLVYFLALRLTRNRGGAAVSALTMALHPAGFESVAWISAINSAALPLALGGWLAFTKAVDSAPGRLRHRWLAFSLVLVAFSLAYRETAVIIVAAMLLWYLLVEVRGTWRTRRTLTLAGSHLVLLALFVAFSGLFSSDGGRDLIRFDADVPKVWWYYVKQALVPSVPEHGSAVFRAQQAAGVVVVMVPILAFWRRQWLAAVLGLGFLVGLLPYAMFSLGYGPRYFYFPSALFALFGGALFVSLAPVVERTLNANAAALALRAGGAVASAALVILGFQRTSEWLGLMPDVHQQWVDQLTAEYPYLPENGGLFVVNTPSSMSLFDAYILQPTVAYLYPGSEHPVYVIGAEHLDYAKSIMKPDDRIFIFNEFPQE
ncbi:MAG: glycosyltransferase family 39 protein [Tepidiformaceae bacterium]